jgi:hypothetical protein
VNDAVERFRTHGDESRSATPPAVSGKRSWGNRSPDTAESSGVA